MQADSDRRGIGSTKVAQRVAAACLLAWVSQAGAEGAKTDYALKQTELDTPSFCYLRTPSSTTKPAHAGAMPAFENGQAVFLELRLGDDAPRLLAVEPLSRGDTSGFRVYMDTNGNRALADETPSETSEDQKLRRGTMQFTAPMTVPVVYRLPSGEVTRYCRFRLGFYPIAPDRRNQDGRLFYSAQLVALQGWTGLVPFGTKKLRLTLFDGDGDAKMQVGNTVSRDGLRLEGTDQTPFNIVNQKLTHCLEVDGVLYSLEVQPDGAKVAVSRYTDALGTVAWAVSSGTGKTAELAQLTLGGANLSVSHRGSVPASHVVPPGDYNLTYMIGKGKQQAYFSVAKPFRIRTDAPNSIVCGGPVILAGTVKQQENADETTLVVNISAANAAGHSFRVLGPTSEAGKVDVLGPDGVPRGTGNMEYG